MTLLAIGVTHHSAPLAVLDDLAIDPERAHDLAANAVRSKFVTEAMVLATCNRLEVLADVTAFHASVQELAEALAKAVGVTKTDLLPHLHVTYGDQAARHLFEVTSGLDSMVVGEQQIIGQVRAALQTAQDSGTAARRLNAVTQSALRAAKRVQSDTDISHQGASVVSVGLSAAAESLPPWPQTRVLVVGAGAMSSLAVATLTDLGVAELTVVNRTYERASRLAANYGATTGRLTDLAEHLTRVDLAVTCTGSTDLVITADLVSNPVTIVDLALPHDTDPALSTLPGVRRIALADLAGRPEAAAPSSDVAKARQLLDAELAEYFASEKTRRLDPLVVSLRARAGEFVAAEADRLRSRLPHLSSADHDEIENGLRRAVNSLLHTPTVRVKELAAEPQGQQLADALHSLFDLPTSVIESLGAPDQADEEGWW